MPFNFESIIAVFGVELFFIYRILHKMTAQASVSQKDFTGSRLFFVMDRVAMLHRGVYKLAEFVGLSIGAKRASDVVRF